MQPLLDGDCLLYEVGFGVETAWKGEGYPSFDYAAELLDNKIANICALVEATEPCIIYLTGKGNFRNDIAKRQKYKERPFNRPFHYDNLKAYMKAKYDCRWQDGLEADDLMSIEQTSRTKETIICTRDKDLRQVYGWHYSWELGSQASSGPLYIEGLGFIRLSARRDSIKGYGDLFFLSQLLTGDQVDTIPGCPGIGPVKALKILEGTTTYKEGLKRVYGAYKAVYGHNAYKEMLEQGRLLYMTRKLREDGSPVLWGQTN